jgi:hypothetical protein
LNETVVTVEIIPPAFQHHVKKCGKVLMINGHSFGLACGSGCEEQIAKIARHLVHRFECAGSGGNPIVYRAAFGSRSRKFSGLLFLFGVQKQVDAGVADNSQISFNGVFRIQWNVTGSAAPNS